MRDALRFVVRAWGELALKLGVFVLLVVGSIAAGAAISLPLWYFATAARGAYTAFALVLAAGAVVYATVRAVIRARSLPQDDRAGKPRHAVLSGLIACVQAVTLLSGLYVVAVLFSHGVWLIAIPAAVLVVGLLFLLGLARRSLKVSRAAAPMPKYRKE